MVFDSSWVFTSVLCRYGSVWVCTGMWFLKCMGMPKCFWMCASKFVLKHLYVSVHLQKSLAHTCTIKKHLCILAHLHKPLFACTRTPLKKIVLTHDPKVFSKLKCDMSCIISYCNNVLQAYRRLHLIVTYSSKDWKLQFGENTLWKSRNFK